MNGLGTGRGLAFNLRTQTSIREQLRLFTQAVTSCTSQIYEAVKGRKNKHWLNFKNLLFFLFLSFVAVDLFLRWRHHQTEHVLVSSACAGLQFLESIRACFSFPLLPHPPWSQMISTFFSNIVSPVNTFFHSPTFCFPLSSLWVKN